MSHSFLFKQILVPIDFSDVSINALRYAIELSKMTKAKLAVLNAIHTPWKIAEYTGVIDYEFTVKYKKEAQEKFASLKKEILELEDLECSFSVALINAKDAILEASCKNIDLIVMGAKARTSIGDIVFGSTIMNVIEQAACSVLVIPEKFKFSKNIQELVLLLSNEQLPKILTKVSPFVENFQARVKIIYLIKSKELKVLAFHDFPKYLNVSYEEVLENELVAFVEQLSRSKQIDLLVISRTERRLLKKLYDRKITKFFRQYSIPVLIPV